MVEELQWGRDLLVAESASFSCQHRATLVIASMGPRLVSRGKHPREVFQHALLTLQWGRDLLVAERYPLIV